MTRGWPYAEIAAVLTAGLLTGALSLLPVPPALAEPVYIAFTLGMVAWIVWQDFADLTIPDGATIAIAAIGAAHRLANPDGSAVQESMTLAVDALACGGALFLIREIFYRLRGVEGMGFGDVKLAAACGILVGITGFSWSLFLASVAGLLAIFCTSRLKPQSAIDRIPFGAFLAPVCWCVWIAGVWNLA